MEVDRDRPGRVAIVDGVVAGVGVAIAWPQVEQVLEGVKLGPTGARGVVVADPELGKASTGVLLPSCVAPRVGVGLCAVAAAAVGVVGVGRDLPAGGVEQAEDGTDTVEVVVRLGGCGPGGGLPVDQESVGTSYSLTSRDTASPLA